MPGLHGIYIGECKKGLAHGRGLAQGIDNYSGQFKNGWPDGKGTYKWENGEKYEGEWKSGFRNGFGVFSFKVNNRDSVLYGLWKDDRYIGPKPKPPLIISKQNITKVDFHRNGVGSKVIISFGGVYQREIHNLTIVGDSGAEFSIGVETGYDIVEFPFHCKIMFTSSNSSQNYEQYCILEFIINQPGNWTVSITN